MNCEQYQEYISQLIDGELDNAYEASLFEHLGSCEQCRTFLKNILSLKNTLTVIRPMAVPASLDQRVLSQSSPTVRQPMRHNLFWHTEKAQFSFRAIGLAAILSVLTSFAVFSLWYTSHQPQPTVVCLTPLPEVEVNGYVIVASSPTKGINQ